MERWRPETNTFFREISITLGDVAQILGLPADGDPFVGIKRDSCEVDSIACFGCEFPGQGQIEISWRGSP